MITAVNLTVEYAAQLVRTVILARCLGAEEFGIAASISAVIAIVEMSMTIGFGRYLVFVPRNEEAASLAAVHVVLILRGVVLAALVCAVAAPIASALDQSAHTLSYMSIAVVIFLRGFQHGGLFLMQRDGRFMPMALAEVGASIAGMTASVVAILIVADHRAILWGLGVQALVLVLSTHLQAPTRYRVSFDRSAIVGVLRFGLPLTINGIALAAANQFDRLVVGFWLGVAALGTYGLVITILLQPISLLLRLLYTVFQPILSKAWHAGSESEFRAIADMVLVLIAALGAVAACCAVCLGAPVFRLVFGTNHHVVDAMFVLLAFLVLLRLVSGTLALFMLARGRTSDLAYTNLAGCLSFVLTIGGLAMLQTIEAALCGLLGAGFLSFVVAIRMVDPRASLIGAAAGRMVFIASVPPALMGIWVLMIKPELEERLYVSVATVFCGVIVGICQFNRQRSRDLSITRRGG